MPDKKLTDSEIIKALEEWRKEIIADYQRLQLLDAPMDCFEESHADTVTNLSNALDLINRLQAKNSNLTSDLTSLQNDLTSAKAENERLKPFEDKIAEFKSHIRVEDMLVFASSLGEWLEFMQKTKAEAYKEFWNSRPERLNEQCKCREEYNKGWNACLDEFWEIRNNLLNELVGDKP